MEHRDYSGAILWQVDHEVPREITARLFGKASTSIPVIAWRAAQGFIPRQTEAVIRTISDAGADADLLLRSLKAEESDFIQPSTIPELEQQIDEFGRRFWKRVRNQKGTKELGLLLRKVSRPSWENIPLRRAAARLYHLLAELYLHAGCCRSSLVFGAKAYRAEAALYQDTLSKYELFNIGKTSLLISQAFINRSEYGNALPWIRRSKEAFTSGSHKIDPEHYKQLATVQFHSGALPEASKNYKLAGTLLGPYKPTATNAEVKDIGERHLNLIGCELDWERAFELMDFALKTWPAGDIHKSLNVTWAAAAAMMTDSPEANNRAHELLHKKGHLSQGYVHPETVTELLLMTPDLPKALRPEWARFSLHYNAFRNK